jgi:hypothetical protein
VEVHLGYLVIGRRIERKSEVVVEEDGKVKRRTQVEVVYRPEGAVPVPFWNRLKHAISRSMLVEQYQAEYELESHQIREARQRLDWTISQEHEREELLFGRWVERLFGPQELWPWSRGWTEEMVDAYLTQAPKPAGRA